MAQRIVDVGGTQTAVTAERDALQAAYDEAMRTRKNGRGLVAPTWPAVPDYVDFDRMRVPAGGPRASRALAIARWFDDLCGIWDGIEGQRLARSYLRELGGNVARPLPVVCGAGETMAAA